MRTIAIVLLLTALAFGQWGGRGGYSPEVNEENNVLFTMPGWIADLYDDIVGVASVTESINGADSFAVWVDINSTTYDFAEVYVAVSMTADEVAGDEQGGATVRCYPYFDVTSWTAGDSLRFQSMNLGTTSFGLLRFTVTCSDSTSGARVFQIGYLLPGTTFTAGPFIVDATVLTDSLAVGFEVITTDSAEVTWTVLAIPRT